MKLKNIISVIAMCLIISVNAQQTHVVKENESIEHIAKTYRVSPSDIQKLNPEIKKDGLKKGNTIKIPSGKVKHYSTQRPLGFITHTVTAKETFFGISQQHNVSIDDIKRYNFDLYSRGLQEGEKISIPIFGKSAGMIEKGIQGQKKYVVKPQETLWRIAKNYKISQEELERMNPGVTASNLREGQEIWVPISSADIIAPPKTADNQELVPYSVEKGEGFYSLERKFGISEAELIKLNPELKSGLKSDSQIWIPKENFNKHRYGLNSVATKPNEGTTNNNVRQISFVLPFKVSDIEGVNKTALKTRLTDNKVTPITTDFYSGVLIALDSLQKMGYNFKVNTFDSETSDKDFQKIASNADLQNSQVVVGPFSAKSFNALSKAISQKNIAILAPFSNKNIDLSANVFQTLPTDELQQQKMIGFVARNHQNANILIISDDKNANLREKLLKNFPNAKVLEVSQARNIAGSIESSRENVVFVQSNDISIVSSVVRSLHVAVSKNPNSPKVILATIDRGSVFDSNSLSNNQLSDLRFTYPTFNKYSDGTDSFSQRYLKTYGILPNKYAVRGFDLTMDVIFRLGTTGDFTYSAQNSEASYVENKFLYLKNASKGGGYENQGVYIVRYEKMEVKTLE